MVSTLGFDTTPSLAATSKSSKRGQAYRPDIDGLRAVAVLSVISFHISGNWIANGYLGVDIFFVLSGYLITSILWRETLQGDYSIARFYSRRIRRIMPALLALLCVTSIAALILLLPIDLVGYAKSAIASLAFVANVYFWRDTDYFSRLAETKPLLHLWSLGIEEQFYIFVPLVIRACGRTRRSLLLWLLSVMVFTSLAADIFAIHAGAASPAFFLLPTRAWELGAGSILSFAVVQQIPPGIRNLLALVAACLLVFGLAYNKPQIAFGIPCSLFVVSGTALIIYIGNVEFTWLNRILSLRLPVAIGLISYSLYLWHWPVLVFARYYLVRPLLPSEVLAALVLMFSLAILSWRYVERPFRTQTVTSRTVMAWTGLGTLVVTATVCVFIVTGGLPGRLNAEASIISEAAGTNFRCNIGDYVAIGASRGCIMPSLLSRQPSEAQVVLLGNSHAQMYEPLVDSILGQHHVGGLLIPANGCLPTPDLNISRDCMTVAQKNLSAVLSLPKVRVVVLATTWPADGLLDKSDGPVPDAQAGSRLVEALDGVIAQLEHAGKTVALVGPFALPGYDVASVMSRELAFGRRVSHPLFTPQPDFEREHGAAVQHFVQEPDLIFIRPDEIQCGGARCEYFLQGRSLFADDSHIAVAALNNFRPVFQKGLDRALRQTNLLGKS